MGRRRHTAEQIITALREAEVGLANGKTVGMVSRELGISEQTYYLPVAPGIRGNEGGPGSALQGTGAGKRTAEASGGEPDRGQADLGGSGQGKLLSPERRRRCVVQVRQRLGATDVVRLASRFGRYGYRQITNLLRIEGWQVNYKRVERIWRQEGLKVPRRQPKRGRLWLGDGSCIRLRPLQ